MPPKGRRWMGGMVAAVAVAFMAACEAHSGPAQAQDEPESLPLPGENPSANSTATAALRDLAEAVWTSAVEDSTYLRLQEGLPIEQFEDLTLEAYRHDQEVAKGFRSRLAEIDHSSLRGDDLITYEILRFDLDDFGATDDDFWLRFDITPYVAPYLFRFAQQALAAQPIRDEPGAQHYLALVGELADLID